MALGSLWAKAKTRLTDDWPLIALMLAAAFVHWELLEHLPRTGDHHCHFFKGWLLAEHLIPSGRLTGWSHMAFAGYPAGFYYPIGGDLYLLAIRVLTLGWVPWEMVFKLSLFALMVASPAMVYVLARRCMEPAFALVAGVFALGEVGGFRQGGSIHTLYWGVWPFALSIIVAYLTLLVFERALDKGGLGRPGPLLLAAAVLTLSLLAHPMAVVYLVVALPVLFLCVLWFGKERRRFKLLLLNALLIGGISSLLAAFWLVPYLIESPQMSIEIGTKWFDLESLAKQIRENNVVKNLHPIAYGAGFVGLLFGLFSRKVWPTFWALSSLGVVAAALVGGVYFDHMIQYERLAAYLKGGWYLLAAYGFAQCFRLAAQVALSFHAGLEPVRPWQISVFTYAVSAGFVVLVVSHDWNKQFGRIPAFHPMGEDLEGDIEEAGGWLAKQPRLSLDRVLIQAGTICTSGNLRRRACRRVNDNHVFESFPVYSGLPKVRFGFQPAEGFEKLPLPRNLGFARATIKEYLSDPVVFENFGIRWVVSLVDFLNRPDLELVERFGSVRVYEVRSRPEPVKLIGEGAVDLVAFEDERIVVDVLGAQPGAVVQLAVAHHPYWHAELDGEPVEIETRPVIKKLKRELLMAVPAKKGRIVLTFDRPSYAVASSWLSAVAWFATLLFPVGSILRRGFRRRADETASVSHAPVEHVREHADAEKLDRADGEAGDRGVEDVVGEEVAVGEQPSRGEEHCENHGDEDSQRLEKQDRPDDEYDEVQRVPNRFDL